VGAHADVIAVDEHPFDDIEALTRVSTVVQAGRVVR
jgi:imidazolonepropionase-like amidohydrolase